MVGHPQAGGGLGAGEPAPHRRRGRLYPQPLRNQGGAVGGSVPAPASRIARAMPRRGPLAGGGPGAGAGLGSHLEKFYGLSADGPAAGGSGAGRPGRAPLHLGHHRLPQGSGAHPRQLFAHRRQLCPHLRPGAPGPPDDRQPPVPRQRPVLFLPGHLVQRSHPCAGREVQRLAHVGLDPRAPGEQGGDAPAPDHHPLQPPAPGGRRRQPGGAGGGRGRAQGPLRRLRAPLRGEAANPLQPHRSPLWPSWGCGRCR